MTLAEKIVRDVMHGLDEAGVEIYSPNDNKATQPSAKMVNVFRSAFESNDALARLIDITLTVKNSRTVELTFIETEKQRRQDCRKVQNGQRALVNLAGLISRW